MTEAILNDVSGSRGGVVGAHQRHSWNAEKKATLEPQRAAKSRFDPFATPSATTVICAFRPAGIHKVEVARRL